MSWIYPVYLPVELQHKYSYKYKLYLYREGTWNGTLVGKPLLFVHGNAGGHKQVRSIGGALHYKHPDLYDVFTVDFNEELSQSLHVISQQTEFVQFCVDHILKKGYSSKWSKMSFVGHSLGGIVIRGIEPSQMDLLYTFSTPHRGYGYIMDPALKKYVDNLYEPKMVSFSGGTRDLLIKTSDTITKNGTNLSTLSLPGVHIGMDHYCICWCKQFIDEVAQNFNSIESWTTNTTRSVGTGKTVTNVHRIVSNGSFDISHPTDTIPKLYQLPYYEVDQKQHFLLHIPSHVPRFFQELDPKKIYTISQENSNDWFEYYDERHDIPVDNSVVFYKTLVLKKGLNMIHFENLNLLYPYTIHASTSNSRFVVKIRGREERYILDPSFELNFDLDGYGVDVEILTSEDITVTMYLNPSMMLMKTFRFYTGIVFLDLFLLTSLSNGLLIPYLITRFWTYSIYYVVILISIVTIRLVFPVIFLKVFFAGVFLFLRWDWITVLAFIVDPMIFSYCFLH